MTLYKKEYNENEYLTIKTKSFSFLGVESIGVNKYYYYFQTNDGHKYRYTCTINKDTGKIIEEDQRIMFYKGFKPPAFAP